MDTQLIELFGRQRLIADLTSAGFEVAMPIRDRGVDLIAYAETGDQFVAHPIQLKVASQESFSVLTKHEKVAGLIMAYVWSVSDPGQSVVHAMTYADAKSIAVSMGWTATASWRAGGYSSNRPSENLKKLLEPYRMNSEKWRQLLI